MKTNPEVSDPLLKIRKENPVFINPGKLVTQSIITSIHTSVI